MLNTDPDPHHPPHPSGLLCGNIWGSMSWLWLWPILIAVLWPKAPRHCGFQRCVLTPHPINFQFGVRNTVGWG